MSIKKWHVGKIILLWIWGFLLTGLTLNIIDSIDNFIVGFLLLAVIIGIPILLSIITWKWLGGKETSVD